MKYLWNLNEISLNTNWSRDLMPFVTGNWIGKLIYFSIVLGIIFIFKLYFPISWKIRYESDYETQQGFFT